MENNEPERLGTDDLPSRKRLRSSALGRAAPNSDSGPALEWQLTNLHRIPRSESAVIIWQLFTRLLADIVATLGINAVSSLSQDRKWMEISDDAHSFRLSLARHDKAG